MVLIEGACAHGGGIWRRSCGAEAVGQCVYCGKPFCSSHGARGEDFIEVCNRKTCRAKWADVLAHQEWRESVAGANRLNMCAHEECADRFEHRCQRCLLMFCAAHVRPHTVVEGYGEERRRVSLVLCPHCIARRDLWD